MKNVHLFVCTVIVLAAGVLGMFPGTASAAKGNFHLSVYSAASIPEDNGLDTELFLSGRLTYDILENVELGLESGWLSYDVEVDGTDFGSINGIPLWSIALWKFPVGENETFVPYLTGGAGVVFWSFDESSVVSDADISASGDTSFAAKAGLGFDVNLNDRAALFVEANYLWSDYDATVTAASVSVDTKTEMNAILVGGGIKFNF